MKKLLKKIAILSLSALPLSVQAKDTGVTGYEIYDGEYISTLLIGDITHDYIGKQGYYDLAYFPNEQNNGRLFYISIDILESGSTAFFITFETPGSSDLIDWEASNLEVPKSNYYFIRTPNIAIYLKKPLKVTHVTTNTRKYLAATSPAQSFAGGYDGFIPSFYYTSISGNKSFFDGIDSVSSLIEGELWTSGNVASLNIKKDGFIIQYYYVSASVMERQAMYDVWLRAFAKSEDGNKMMDFNLKELVFVDLNLNDRKVESYDFPYPVSCLKTIEGYYNIIHSSGAYGITDSVMTYQEGYKDGQANPTFKSFIVSAFEACSAFFALPVLGQNITIGTLIGSFVGLGALFLLIRLFR